MDFGGKGRGKSCSSYFQVRVQAAECNAMSSELRKAGGKLGLTAALSLKEFLQRQRVLRLYRNLLKSASHPTDRTSFEAVRTAFRTHASNSDPASIRALMADGTKALEMLHNQRATNSFSERIKPPHTSEKALSTPEDSEDSWLHSGSGDDEDVRGRVGTGWPWQR